MKWIAVLLLVLGAAGAMMIPVGGGMVDEDVSHGDRSPAVEATAFAAISDAPPGESLRLLFIHHSCGGRWMADSGADQGENCINVSHPSGGGLRSALQAAGYEVHEASYGSRIGARTDIFDWPEKFRADMDAILACDHQDTAYSDGRRNHIVMFKSCFPNNLFLPARPGTSPSKPQGPELTVANAQAAYRSLLPEFAKHPEVLFVCVTAPPLAPKIHPERLGKRLVRAVLGKPSRAAAKVASAREARRFNNWLKGPDGWLDGYTAKNVAVFDFYDVLTDGGASDLSRYGDKGGFDSHPNRAGNEKATALVLPFLNRAVRRSGLIGADED